MVISPSVDHWLQEAGYEYHCFISWARTSNEQMTECAESLGKAIEQQLALSIPRPNVFFDKTGINVGEDWRKKIGQALCRSVALVAVCAPIYYHQSHEWCGIEWAAMDRLGQKRLPGGEIKTIIPVMVKNCSPLPAAVASIQHIDFSRLNVIGANYYRTKEYRLKVSHIAERIAIIAEAIAFNQIRANCRTFQLPTKTAFSDYVVKNQPFPFKR